MKGRKAPAASKDQTSETWNRVPWKKLEQHCFRIQKRIYRASQRGNQRAVHKLQKLLMKSAAARLLAVRRVTQENQGKKTAGVDGVKSFKPKNACSWHITFTQNTGSTSKRSRYAEYGYPSLGRTRSGL